MGFRVGCSSVAVVLALAGSALGQCANFWQAPGPNGTVTASCLWDPDGAGPMTVRVVVAGSFTRVENLATSNIAAWDPVGGGWTPLGVGLPAGTSPMALNAVAAGPDGSLYVAGWFDTAGGVAASNIARWDQGTKTWSALGTGLNAPAYALHVMPDGDVIAGGDFGTAGGVPTVGVARWDAQTQAWQPMASFMDNTVRSITSLADGDIVVGGWITQVNNLQVASVLRWDAQTGAWGTLGAGVSGTPATVYGLATASDGDVVAVGDFSTAGGVAARGVARWDAQTNLWSGVGGGISGGAAEAYTVAVATDGDIVIGGLFAQAGTSPGENCARFDVAAGAWAGVANVSSTTSVVNTATALPDGRALVGGSFAEGGTSPFPSWVNAMIVEANSASSPTRKAANRLAVVDVKLATGGDQYLAASTNGVVAPIFPSSRMALRDAATWGLLPFSTRPGTNGSEQFALAGNGLMLRLRGDGLALEVIARGSDTVLGTYAWPAGRTPNFRRMRNGDILVAGWGQAVVDGVTVNGMARWNPRTGVWSEFASQGNPNTVGAMCEGSDGSLWAAAAGSATSDSLLRWNPALGTWATYTMPVAVGNAVLCEAPDGDILWAGNYTDGNAVSWDAVVRWDRQTGVISRYPDLPATSIVRGVFVAPDGTVRLAGAGIRFDGIGYAPCVARFDEAAAAWRLDFGLFSTSLFESMALPNGDIVLPISGERYVYRAVPWVAEQPEATEAVAGTTLTLNAVPAEGYTGVNVRWQRNGLDIANGANGASSGGGVVSGASGALAIPTDNSVAELTIHGVQQSDAGVYRAIFTCPCGSVTTVEATVTVAEDPCPCPADVDCSGGVDSDDVIVYFAAWDQNLGSADFNGDGGVDADDVIAFFGNWDAGC